MISAASSTESGLPSVEYYAPNYRIEIEGAELDQTTKGDVLQLKVTMEKDNLTGFNLTMNNWDDRKLTFKHSDDDTFFIGRRIHILMGYADRLVSMVRGQINSMSPKFPQSGSPTMEVSGTDLLFTLKDSKPADGDPLIHVNKQDWQIAQEVAKRNNLDIEVTREGPTHPIVVQEKDKDDASFLLDRARRIDFDLYMRTDPKTQKDKLFFVKPTDGRDSQPIRVYRFEWGKTLMSFSPKLTVNQQVASVTVRGWNPLTKEPFVVKADSDDLPKTGGKGNSGPSAVTKNAGRPGGKQEFIVDASVVSEDEAKKLAVSRLTERAYQYNQGSGQVIGQSELRPGDTVQLLGLGTRFSGPEDQPIRYRIRKVDHTIGGSGFLTQFDVETLNDGG